MSGAALGAVTVAAAASLPVSVSDGIGPAGHHRAERSGAEHGDDGDRQAGSPATVVRFAPELLVVDVRRAGR